MQRTYKRLLRGLSVVVFSSVIMSGAVAKLGQKETSDAKDGTAPANKIFLAFTPQIAHADIPVGDSGDCGYICDACGDSCDDGAGF
jgi:hypothetical protein